MQRSIYFRPLKPYEPIKRRPAAPALPVRADGQLALELPVAAGPPTRGEPVPSFDSRMATRLIAAILEAYDGSRSPRQVQQLLHPDLYRRLLRERRTGRPRYVVRAVRGCRPAPGVVEASATVNAGPRVVAVAARFEAMPSGWQCTRFALLEPQVRPQSLSA